MNIVATTIENSYDSTRRSFTIEIDGTPVFYVIDGEPEDSNLYRDFRDCFKITELMKRAWEAGKKGEAFTLTAVNKEEDD